MRIFLTRALAPALLVLAGIAALVAGARSRYPVLEEKQIDATIRIPVPASMFPPGMESSDSWEMAPSTHGPQPGATPQFITKKVKQTKSVTVFDSEGKLLQELTFGGVALLSRATRRSPSKFWDLAFRTAALLDDGRLKRTYSGKPPALCPT